MRYVELVIACSLVVLIDVALFRVLKRAGLSGYWLVVPVTPAVVYGAWVGWTQMAMRSGNLGGANQLRTSADLLLLVLANWALYLIVAFHSCTSTDARAQGDSSATGSSSRQPSFLESLAPPMREDSMPILATLVTSRTVSPPMVESREAAEAGPYCYSCGSPRART